MGESYDLGGNGLWVFVLVTCILGGAAAYLSGRAMAQTWRPYWQVPLYMVGIAAGVRFVHHALFEGPVLSAPSFAAAGAALVSDPSRPAPAAVAPPRFRMLRRVRLIRRAPASRRGG